MNRRRSCNTCTCYVTSPNLADMRSNQARTSTERRKQRPTLTLTPTPDFVAKLGAAHEHSCARSSLNIAHPVHRLCNVDIIHRLSNCPSLNDFCQRTNYIQRNIMVKGLNANKSKETLFLLKVSAKCIASRCSSSMPKLTLTTKESLDKWEPIVISPEVAESNKFRVQPIGCLAKAAEYRCCVGEYTHYIHSFIGE